MSTNFLDAMGTPLDLSWPSDRIASHIDPHVVAHALSLLCRFGGHCREFYSVAQHSCLVHDLVADGLAAGGVVGPGALQFRRAALLHDATEGLGFGDLISPLRRMLGDRAREVEDRLEDAAARRFGMPAGLLSHAVIKKADRVALWTEMRDVRGAHGSGGYSVDYHVERGGISRERADLMPAPADIRIQPAPPRVARAGFLRRLADCWPTGEVQIDWSHP